MQQFLPYVLMIMIGTMSNLSGIYIISSKKFPGRIYIGSSVDMRKRWNRHKRDLVNQCHHNNKLQNHVNKYGLGDIFLKFKFQFRPEVLITTEQIFINICDPYFNINPTAASRLNSKQSIETRLKISKASKASPKEDVVKRYARLTGLIE